MFRRLAELTHKKEGFNDNQQTAYNRNQSYRYNTLLPNIIPSSGTAPVSQELQASIQGVNPWSSSPLATSVVPEANQLFVPSNISAEFQRQQQVCAAGSIDGLIGSQDATRNVRCGWVYTPPSALSPFPVVSQGVLGTVKGPIGFNGNYTKWYWDLAEAKKQVLIDKCKALRNCTDVGNDPYAGDCGYCEDIGQGVPVDSNGRPLYMDSPKTACSSVVTTGAKCAPPPPTIPGMATPSSACTPVSGRLPFGCLESILEQAGCSSNGTLSLALGSGAKADTISKLPSMVLYNKHVSTPFPVDVFAQGRLDTATALSEAITLNGNATKESHKSAIGAAARDLCIKKGAIDQFDFCSEILLTTPPPFNMVCLQKAFRKAGGQPAGAKYPSPGNMASFYNTNFSNWGAALGYINGLANAAKGKEGFQDMLAVRSAYSTQATALTDFLGITPDDLSNRAPLKQGIEMFWFNTLTGLLVNVTVEGDYPNYPYGSGAIIPQLGFAAYGQFFAITDVRVAADTAANVSVYSDDGVVLALNRAVDLTPNKIVNTDGYLAANVLQGPTTYKSKECWTFTKAGPNILKTYWHDKGGGGHTFKFDAVACTGTSTGALGPSNYSLTREASGPFISFENNKDGEFADLRLPEVFNIKSGGNSSTNIQAYYDADSKIKAPGKNGFLRFNSGTSSHLTLSNISCSTWNTLTFVFRLNAMPVKDNLLYFIFGNPGRGLQLFLTPVNGSMAQLLFSNNMRNIPQINIQTTATLAIGGWYMCQIVQNGGGRMVESITVSFGLVADVAAKGAAGFSPMNVVQIPADGVINSVNSPALFILGHMNYLAGTSSFNMDVAWLHMFNGFLTSDDLKREAMNKWLVTPGGMQSWGMQSLPPSPP